MMLSVLRALSCNAISECNNASHVTLHNTFYFLDIDKQVSFNNWYINTTLYNIAISNTVFNI